MLRRRLFEFVAEPLAAANREQREYLNSPQSQGADRETVVVLLLTAVALTLQQYLFTPEYKERLIDAIVWAAPESWSAALEQSLRNSENEELVRRGFWACGQIFVYVVLPALAIWLLLGKRMRDYGWKLSGAFSCWPVYLLFFLAVAPCVVMVSDNAAFQYTYPFYRLRAGEPLWPRFIMWEALYAAQFVALEFFFRGFVLHGARRRCGAYAILVMTIPYCMIHFGKPMLETFAAIIAGIVLGFMSLKTRSIWMGAALHIAVAWMMDAMALWRAGP